MTRIDVLTRAIPSGGFGRPLTSTEIKRIRATGRRCGRAWIVLQDRQEWQGIVYRPSPGGGYDHAGIYVS